MAVKNRTYTTRSPKEKKKKKTTTYEHRPTRTSLSNKCNSQERRGNDDDDDGKTNYIPTIINGITDITHMSQLNSRNKVSVYNLLSELNIQKKTL